MNTTKLPRTAEQPAVGAQVQRSVSWPVGARLHLLAGRGVPNWLHSFAGDVVAIGRTRYKVSVPVDDGRLRWVPATQLQRDDPWAS